MAVCCVWQVAAAHAAAAESAGAAVRGEAAQQLTVLKERLLACLTSNAAADEADRIDEKELIVDQDSLKVGAGYHHVVRSSSLWNIF